MSEESYGAARHQPADHYIKRMDEGELVALIEQENLEDALTEELTRRLGQRGLELVTTYPSDGPKEIMYTRGEERVSDDELIQDAIFEAASKRQPIDHAAARMIASQYHSGQDSALYAFASTGAITGELLNEINFELSRSDRELEPQAESVLEALDEYIIDRIELDAVGPVKDWSTLWLGEQHE